MQWKHPSSPSRSAKKFTVTPAAGKVMLNVFWDSQGVLLAHFQKRDCDVLLKLRDAIRGKQFEEMSRPTGKRSTASS
jgi:hypothetical protein